MAAEVGEDRTLAAVRLDADPRSLQVRAGLRGVRPLTDRDRDQIRKTVNEEDRPRELELAGTRRPASFELTAAADGRVRGTLPVTLSEWGSSLIGR